MRYSRRRMGRFTDISRLCALGAAMVLTWFLVPGHLASADDTVPTASIVAPTPQSSVQVSTDVVPVATEQALPPPTPARERSTPIVTVVEQPTVGEGPAPTAPPSRVDRPFSTFTSVVPTPTPVPSQAQVQIPVEAPLP